MEIIKLTEILYDLEFDYKINNDNTLSLIDDLIEPSSINTKKFTIDENLAEKVINTLQKEISAYHIWEYVDRLEYDCKQFVPDKDNWYEILTLMREHYDEFKYSIPKFEAIIVPKLFDISDILENKEITERCPRCGSRLYKNSHSEKTFYCRECNECFYTFECMGVVKCTKELI